jgi:Uma2 family endonuclease
MRSLCLLISALDGGIVFAMDEHPRTTNYLAGVEDMRRRELVWGYVREPPAPKFGHPAVVTRTTLLLDRHVRMHALGLVCVSPIDVVLDGPNALILQPDIVFVSNDRKSIVRDQVCGAPDLVVEVVAPRTKVSDRTMKVLWYAHHGVRECWLVDPTDRTVVTMNLETAEERQCAGDALITSWVLPLLANTPRELFDE